MLTTAAGTLHPSSLKVGSRKIKKDDIINILCSFLSIIHLQVVQRSNCTFICLYCLTKTSFLTAYIFYSTLPMLGFR